MQGLARLRQHVHLAGADADPRCDVLRAQGGLRIDSGADCAQRVVLVQLRHAEHRHHGVADELLERSAVPLDRLAHELEVARQQRAVRLRVELGRKVGRADQVAQQHRHGAPVRRPRDGGFPGRAERRVLTKDRVLQRTELFARLEAELLRQHVARGPVRRQRLRLAPRAVERPHQLRAEPLAQRVLLDERLELADEIGVPAHFQLGVDAVLECREPGLLQPAGLVARERLEGEIVQRGAAPQGQCRAELLPALARFRATCLGRQPLEAREVEALGIDPQDVAGRLGHDRLRADRLPQPRDVVLQRRSGRLRRLRSPHLVDQPVGGDELVGVQQQERQE